MQITKEQVVKRLREADFITILCHRKPDGDTLGSGFGLYYALRQLGKTCRVLCASGYPPLYDFMFGQYEPEQFEEQMVVAVDVASMPLLGDLKKVYDGRVDLAIDHHFSNTLFAGESWVNGDASAAAEMIWQVVRDLGVEITPEIAICIYTGILTDTGGFRYANVTPLCLRIAADFVEAGFDTLMVNQALFQTKSPGSIAFESQVMADIRYYCEGSLAIISTDPALQAKYGLDDYDLEGISEKPRQIKGVLAGVTIRQDKDECRVSMRTKAPVDASAICGSFGGGGHLRAAGCSIKGTLEEAEKAIVAEVSKHLAQLTTD